MAKPSDKPKKRKFRRKAFGKAREYFEKPEKGRRKCGVCGKILAGTRSEKKSRKESKSQKRPSGKFGGILCGRCRRLVIEEAVKVREGIKQLKNVDIRLRGYVKELSE